MKTQRTSFIVRCPAQVASMIRAEAAAQHRSMSGYLLHILERSVRIEEKFAAGLVRSIPGQSGTITNAALGKAKAAIHLCCSVEQLDRIHAAASRREMSINAFILFAVRRHWKAVEQLRGESGFAGDAG